MKYLNTVVDQQFFYGCHTVGHSVFFVIQIAEQSLFGTLITVIDDFGNAVNAADMISNGIENKISSFSFVDFLLSLRLSPASGHGIIIITFPHRNQIITPAVT
jgi:hypothetical protein